MFAEKLLYNACVKQYNVKIPFLLVIRALEIMYGFGQYTTYYKVHYKVKSYIRYSIDIPLQISNVEYTSKFPNCGVGMCDL